MYSYPYGDNQQINLNWIISEIIALHQQLDPDYTAPTFTQIYPFSETQQLNLDWILAELKALKELAPSEDAALLKMVANALLAGEYSPTQPYVVDDIVYNDTENRLFRCIVDTAQSGEPWTPAHWEEIKVGDVLTELLTGGAIDVGVTNVRFNNHYLQQEKNGAYQNIILVDDVATNHDDRLLSSKALYDIGNIKFVTFDTTSITTQVDNIVAIGVYFGTVQGATIGLPIASSGTVQIMAYNANQKRILYYPNGSFDLVYELEKSNGNWRPAWITLPQRDEITTITNDISTINGNITTINGNISNINGNINTINGNITTLQNGINAHAKQIVSESAKTTHTVTVPAGTSHLLLLYGGALSTNCVMYISATSTGILGYDILAQGSGAGSPTIAYNTGNFTVTYDTARNLNIIDIAVLGNFCTLS